MLAAALNFVPDAEGAALEMARVTKPSGVVAASGWDFCGGLTFLRVFAEYRSGARPRWRSVPGETVLGSLHRPRRTRCDVDENGPARSFKLSTPRGATVNVPGNVTRDVTGDVTGDVTLGHLLPDL
jgi:hypothetical protein